MKELIISLVLFALLLAGIALNASFVKGVSAELTEYSRRLEGGDGTEQALQELSDRWIEAKKLLDLTVPHRESSKIAEIILSLQVAYDSGDSEAFARYCKLLAYAAEGLARSERLTLSLFSYGISEQPSVNT